MNCTAIFAVGLLTAVTSLAHAEDSADLPPRNREVIIAVHEREGASTSVADVAARLVAARKPDSASISARLHDRLIDELTPTTKPEIERAIALADRADEASTPERDEALAILARTTERDLRVESAIKRLDPHWAWRVQTQDEPSVWIAPVGFGENVRPILYIDGLPYPDLKKGRDGFAVTAQPGYYNVHFRCNGVVCSRTMRVMVTPNAGRKIVVPSRELRERFTTSPPTLTFESADLAGGVSAGRAIAQLLSGELITTVTLVLPEGARVRLVRVGPEGTIGTLVTDADNAIDAAARLERGETESSLAGDPMGKATVQLISMPGSPPLVSIASSFDPQPLPATEICATNPCTFHVPRGRLRMRFSEDNDDDKGSTRVIDVQDNEQVTVSPARHRRLARVGKIVAVTGLGVALLAAAELGLVSAACKANRIGQPNDGSRTCHNKDSLETTGKVFAISGSAALIVGGTLALSFRPFRVTVKPMVSN